MREQQKLSKPFESSEKPLNKKETNIKMSGTKPVDDRLKNLKQLMNDAVWDNLKSSAFQNISSAKNVLASCTGDMSAVEKEFREANQALEDMESMLSDIQRDSEDFNRELQGIASSLGVELPLSLDEEDEEAGQKSFDTDEMKENTQNSSEGFAEGSLDEGTESSDCTPDLAANVVLCRSGVQHDIMTPMVSRYRKQ